MVKELPPIRVNCPTHGTQTLNYFDILLRVEEGVHVVYFDCPHCPGHWHKNATTDAKVVAQFQASGYVPSDMPLEVWERRGVVRQAKRLTLDDLIEMHARLESAPSSPFPAREQL